jgi:flagellar basal-body rod modification protein FlgD
MDITSINNSTPVQAPQVPATTTSGGDALANEQTFLKLFVAQLKNQDPSSPQDPTQFVAQLAQFSQLEQSLQMRQDLDAMKQIMTTPAPVATPAVTPVP